MGAFKNNFLRNILLLCCSLTTAYLLGEWIVYTLYKDKIVIFPRYTTDFTYNNFRIRGNVPNAHYYHKSIDGKWEFFINKKGFRNTKEFDYVKPKDILRILTLGDSFTIGYEVQQDQTYSAILEKYLNRKGLTAEVINAGVSGFGNAEELVFFEQEGIKYQPDVLILGFYQNDLTDNLRSDIYRLGNNSLVLHNTEYVPAIKVSNFLSSLFLYRWLSDHSYLHNYLNNALSVYIKNKIEERNLNEISKSKEVAKPIALSDNGKHNSRGRSKSESVVEPTSSDRKEYNEKLAIELIRRIYSIAKEHNIYFILVDIPTPDLKASFPVLEASEYPNLCDLYFNSLEVLKDYQGLIGLYVPHGHNHWSQFSHLLVGKKLGEILIDHFDFINLRRATKNP
jgi:hypothetical protein